MDNFNKVLSFILGLIVIIILFVVISSRLKLSDKITFLPLTKRSKTLSPTPKPSRQPASVKIVDTFKKQPTVMQQQTKGGAPLITPAPTGAKKLTKIPETGPELLFPIAFSTMLAGAFLKKKSK